MCAVAALLILVASREGFRVAIATALHRSYYVLKYCTYSHPPFVPKTRKIIASDVPEFSRGGTLK